MDLTVSPLRARPSGPRCRFGNLWQTRRPDQEKICCAMCEVGPSSITDTRGAASSGAKHPDAVEIVAGILGETLVPYRVHHCRWGEPSYRGGRVTGATNRAEAAAGRRFRRPWGRAPRLEAAARTADGKKSGQPCKPGSGRAKPEPACPHRPRSGCSVKVGV